MNYTKCGQKVFDTPYVMTFALFSPKSKAL